MRKVLTQRERVDVTYWVTYLWVWVCESACIRGNLPENLASLCSLDFSLTSYSS